MLSRKATNHTEFVMTLKRSDKDTVVSILSSWIRNILVDSLRLQACDAMLPARKQKPVQSVRVQTKAYQEK